MSKREYSICDGKGCGKCSADEQPWVYEPGWARLELYGGESYDLCPECAKKVLELMGAKR